MTNFNFGVFTVTSQDSVFSPDDTFCDSALGEREVCPPGDVRRADEPDWRLGEFERVFGVQSLSRLHGLFLDDLRAAFLPAHTTILLMQRRNWSAGSREFDRTTQLAHILPAPIRTSYLRSLRENVEGAIDALITSFNRPFAPPPNDIPLHLIGLLDGINVLHPTIVSPELWAQLQNALIPFVERLLAAIDGLLRAASHDRSNEHLIPLLRAFFSLRLFWDNLELVGRADLVSHMATTERGLLRRALVEAMADARFTLQTTELDRVNFDLTLGVLNVFFNRAVELGLPLNAATRRTITDLRTQLQARTRTHDPFVTIVRDELRGLQPSPAPTPSTPSSPPTASPPRF